MNNYHLSADGEQRLHTREGWRAAPYLCSAGYPTIGFGSRFYKNGKAVTLCDAPITREQGVALFRTTIGGYEFSVNKYVTVALKQCEFDALVSFTYNLGEAALRGSTLLKKLNAGDKAGAADEFLKWDKETKRGVKVRNEGLAKRRAAERAQFLGK